MNTRVQEENQARFSLSCFFPEEAHEACCHSRSLETERSVSDALSPERITGAPSTCHRLSLVITQKTCRAERIPQRSNPSLFTDDQEKLRPKGALTRLEQSETQLRDSRFPSLNQNSKDLKWILVPLWRHPVTIINRGTFATQEAVQM